MLRDFRKAKLILLHSLRKLLISHIYVTFLNCDICAIYYKNMLSKMRLHYIKVDIVFQCSCFSCYNHANRELHSPNQILKVPSDDNSCFEYRCQRVRADNPYVEPQHWYTRWSKNWGIRPSITSRCIDFHCFVYPVHFVTKLTKRGMVLRSNMHGLF